MNVPGWPPCAAADAPAPAAGRVDVWLVDLDDASDGGAARCLTAAEVAHAARLRVDGARWAASRAALRVLLGAALGVDAHAVALEPAAEGRPRLAAAPHLRVSLSHAGPYALVALRLGEDVGVDLERVRGDVDTAALARDHLTSRARARIAAAADPREAFFAEWVRAEALAKWDGRGLPALGGPEPGGVRVVPLPAPAGFHAAAASRGGGWRAACRRLALPAGVPA